MRMQQFFRPAAIAASVIGLICTGCGMTPDGLVPEEVNRGLIVVYSGASSEPLEETLWLVGFKGAGITQAVQGMPWGIPGDSYNNAVIPERSREFAQREAQRLAQYMDDYPGRPVTLIGYSAGALVTAFVAEAMPPGYKISRFIMVSADASPYYNLTPALDNTTLGGVSFWSPIDDAITALTTDIGTLDGYKGIPAAQAGFVTDDPRMLQLSWNGEWLLYGHLGKHFDYIFNPVWFGHFVAPQIPPNGA